MRLVINISDYDMEYINNAHDIPKDISLSIAEAILDGKVIPPHGRLIDADALLNKTICNPLWSPYITKKMVLDAKTVIEAENGT